VNYLVTFTFLRHQYPAVAHILIHLEFLLSSLNRVLKINVRFGLGPGSGLKISPVYNSTSYALNKAAKTYVWLVHNLKSCCSRVIDAYPHSFYA